MTSRIIVIVVVLLTVTLLPLSETVAGTNSAASLRLDLHKGNQQVVNVAVYAEDVSELTAYRIDLQYDSNLFSWNDISTQASSEGGEVNMLSSKGGITPIFLKTQREDRIIVANAIMKPDHRTTPSGDGLLGVISFTPSGELPVGSEVTFSLSRAELKGIARDDIDIIEALGPVQLTVRLTLSGFKDPKYIPTAYSLSQNYPNPFNPETVIHYDLPLRSHVAISVYNMMGQKVTTLVDNKMDAGSHFVVWDGKDNNGESVASGIYLYRMETDRFVQTRKLVLMK